MEEAQVEEKGNQLEKKKTLGAEAREVTWIVDKETR